MRHNSGNSNGRQRCVGGDKARGVDNRAEEGRSGGGRQAKERKQGGQAVSARSRDTAQGSDGEEGIEGGVEGGTEGGWQPNSRVARPADPTDQRSQDGHGKCK